MNSFVVGTTLELMDEKGEVKYASINVNPADVARYFLYRSSVDGDLITPLKMQKMVYLAYGAHLARKRERLFAEKMEAWPNGPVVPSLYHMLKKYGSAPISGDFIDASSIGELESRFSSDVKRTLDVVYENYISKSAFELVAITHQQKAWLEARKGLDDTQSSNNALEDELILQGFVNGGA